MKALRLEEPQRFAAVELNEPGDPAPHEAIVRVHRVGVCGTDLSGYLGKFPFMKYPRILGHELGVEVLVVGAEVDGLSVGERCSVEPYLNDPKSFASRRGATNCCDQLQVLGVMTDGGMRERFCIRADKLHSGGDLSFDDLALVETLGIGCHAIKRAAVAADEAVLIVGAGPIGLATLTFAQLAGARCVVADLNDARLAFCRERMGGPLTLQGKQLSVESVRNAFDGDLPTAIFDCTGVKASVEHAFTLLAPTGRLVLVGITTGEISFSHPEMHRGERCIMSSRNSLPEDFREIIGLLQAGKIDTSPWVTRRAPLLEAPQLFADAVQPDSNIVKAVIDVS